MTPTLALVLASLIAVAGNERLSPHQRAILESKSPPPVEMRFSFDAPAGPQFTEAEKQAQRERGQQVLPQVTKAFASGADEVRIPPGDYRFGQEHYEGAKVIFPLGFTDMQRDAEHPFVIDATGATFWFDLGDEQMPPGHRCVGFRNCSNIVLRPRPDDVVEVNPLVPEGTWDYFCLDRVPYHRRMLTILWDKTGNRYGKGNGLRVLADDREIVHRGMLLRVTGKLTSHGITQTR